MAPDEAAVLDAVDDAAILADLAELVAIPSVDGSPEENAAQAWCADRLASLGLAVDHWRIDVGELEARPEFPGMEVSRDEAYGCVGVLGGAADERPALALNGHVDVVPAGDLAAWPGHDPYAVRLINDAMWGRGTCDMKGGVAAILGAVAALQNAGVELRRPLAVHTVVGEEDGGLGTYATLRQGHLAEACVIAEPSAGSLIPSNAGALTFRLEVAGRAAHGSMRSHGVSAVDKFEMINTALRRLETERNREPDPLFAHLDVPYPLAIGTVHAGDWASTVPDRLVAEGRYGVRPGEAVADAQADFETAVAEACAADPWLAAHPAGVSWPGGMFAPGVIPTEHPLVDQVGAAVEDVTGSRPGARGAPYGSDLRHYGAAGVPCLQYGPGDVRFAHSSEEHVPVADVLRCARGYALLALRLCGSTDDR